MTIFERIISREIPADIVFEDDDVLAFRDIHPQAPVHILVIPKRPIPQISDITPADAKLLGIMMVRATEVARNQGLSDYRMVINNGVEAGQSVFHLHLHVLGGRVMGWPPG